MISTGTDGYDQHGLVVDESISQRKLQWPSTPVFGFEVLPKL